MQTEAQKIAQIAQSGDFETAYQLCLATGIDFCALPVNFADMLETDPDADWDDTAFKMLRICNGKYCISVSQGGAAKSIGNSTYEMGFDLKGRGLEPMEAANLPKLRHCSRYFAEENCALFSYVNNTNILYLINYLLTNDSKH